MILLCDNNLILCHTFESLLTTRGHAVRIVNSGEECVKLLQSGFLPDVLLLDIVLPGMDGNEVIRLIQDLDKKPPIVVISISPDLLASELKPFVQCIILKPFESDSQLYSLVEQWSKPEVREQS